MLSMYGGRASWWIIMPLSALPPWIKDQAEGTTTDWNNSIQKKWKKSWFAYGPRATESWAKWREWPITLFALFGKGPARFEGEGWERDSGFQEGARMGHLWRFDPAKMKLFRPVYLSAIQYWAKWHIQIQWPFFIAFHYYIDSVPKYPEPSANKRVFYFRFGCRRDADKVYWFPSIFIGLTFN